MSVNFVNVQSCYNGFTSPFEFENPSNCDDSLHNLNRKILTESIEIFNANIIIGDPEWSNKCSNSPIWHDWYASTRIGLYAAFLIFYVILLPAFCIRARRRSSKASGIIGYFWYGLAVLSTVLYLMLAIIGDAFLNCLKISAQDYLKIYTGVNVFRNLADVLLLIICALPVTRHLLHHGGYGAAFATITNGLGVILVFLLYVVYMVLYDLNTFRAFDGTETFDNTYGVPAAYVTVYLVTALSIAFWVTRAVSGMFKHGRVTRGITPWSNLLVAMLVGFSIINALAIYIWKVHFRWWRRVDSITFEVLDLFFQASIFLLLALLAGSKGLEQTPYSTPEPRKSKEMIVPAAVAGGAVAGAAGVAAAGHFRSEDDRSIRSGYDDRDVESGRHIGRAITDDVSSIHSDDISEIGSDVASEPGTHDDDFDLKERIHRNSHQDTETITEVEEPPVQRTNTHHSGHFTEHLDGNSDGGDNVTAAADAPAVPPTVKYA